MAGDRTLGQVLHAARIEHNPPTERPRNVAPWDERAGWQQDLDEAMAADLDAEVRRRVAAEIRALAARRWHAGNVLEREAAHLIADMVARNGTCKDTS